MKPFRSIVAAASLATLVVAFGSLAQRLRPDQQQPSPELQRAVATAAAKYRIPGIAVAVVAPGRITALDLYGVADQQSGTPIRENTVFEADALGEPVFAYAVLHLASEGRLDLGVPLTRYLPLPYVRSIDPLAASSGTDPVYDPRLNQITAIRILNHTSGMPDWARNDHLRLRSLPGHDWAFSNEGDIYLQQVIEHITGQPISDFLASTVLQPAGMVHSIFAWREGDAPAISNGYDSYGSRVEVDKFARPAAGATLYTTIEDYARFVAILLASAPAQRLHESSVSLMLQSTVTVDQANSLYWGLGVAIEKNAGDEFFLHRGTNRGFASFFIASRSSGSGVVVLTNSANGLKAVPDIVAATLGGEHPALKSDFFRPR